MDRWIGGWIRGREGGRKENGAEKKHIEWEYRYKAMVTHSSTLAWRIPWTEEPGGLQSMGSQRVGHY